MAANRVVLSVSMIFSLLFVSAPAFSLATDVPRIFPDELKTLLETQEVTVLDVRSEPSWKDADRKITGAVRESPGAVASWKDKYDKDALLVLYCS